MCTYLDIFKVSEFYQLELKKKPKGEDAPFDNFFKIVGLIHNLCKDQKLLWNQHEKLNIFVIFHVHKVQV